MKTRIKKLISLLCVVSMLAGVVLTNQFLSAKAETSNAQLETLPTDMTEITFSDFGFEDKEYTYYPYKAYSGDTMDNTLFGGKITFQAYEGEYCLQYGGKDKYQGFNLKPTQTQSGEWYLRLFPTSGMSFNYDLYAGVAGLESFVNKEFLLHISMEYVDYHNDGQKDDVKLGVWFNKNLYNNQYFYLENFVNTSFSVGTTMSLYTASKPIKVKSYYSLPQGMTDITFSDFGFEDGDLTEGYPSGQYSGTTMDNTLFSGKITFPEKANVFLQYGGKTAGGGFNFGTGQKQSGEWYLRLFDTRQGGGAAKFPEYSFTSDVAGVTLVGQELKFNISMEYVDHDGNGAKNDVKLGVWFGGQLYNNKYIYLDNFVDNTHSVGTVMSFYAAKGVNIKSANHKLPTDMTKITFSDFGFNDGSYTYYPYKAYSGATMDNTLFGGKITFQEFEGEYCLQYGGKDKYQGFNLKPTKNPTTGEWYLRLFPTSGGTFNYNLYSGVAGVQLVGKEFLLHISMEYVDYHNDGKTDDVKLGIWFNEKLYDDSYFYLENFVDTSFSVGTTMSLYTASKEIAIKSYYTLPTDMKQISFRDFGFVDGALAEGYPSGQYEGTTMDNTLFSGKIIFPKKADVFIQYGGTVAGGGFNFGTGRKQSGEWYLRLFDTRKDGGAAKFSECSFTSDVAGVTLVGEELEFNISMEYVDHDGGGTENDVKLGVWFGGQLYNNKYIYLDNFVDNTHSVGTVMSFYAAKGVEIESVGPINWKPLPTGMTEITFRDFGYINGVLTEGYPSKQYDGETLDNTLFSGKITFPERKDVYLQYGGKVAGGGFNLGTGYNDTTGEWYLRLYDTRWSGFSAKEFHADVALVPLVGQELELNISMEYVDHDNGGEKNDVKLGVWFGGKLYNNNYIYLDNYVNTDHCMGTMMSFYSGTGVDIESVGAVNWKPLPTGMTEITFRDFGYIDGPLTEAYPSKQYDGETLDNTLFSGKITFPEKVDVYLQYGGKKAGKGFNLGTGYTDDKGWYLRLYDTDWSGFAAKEFYSDIAEVPLVGQELEFNMSMEYVDHDGGGAKDDVKLGVWFGGKLYNNNYIYLDNYVNKENSMGTIMSFYAAKGVDIESVGTINWKDLPTGMTEISFRDFGFIDGKIESGYPSGKYEGTTLDNTMFIGKITFPEKKDVYLQYGGKVAGGGFNLGTGYNEKTGEYYLRLYDTKWSGFTPLELYSDVAGVELVGKEIALILTTQYVDHDNDGEKDDVKLGVWFGGKLYNNNYFYLDNYVNKEHCMGTILSFYAAKGMEIKSVGEVVWEQLPTDFTQLTFSDYGIKAGVYEGGTKTGTCNLESMDRTLFSGIVTYSTEGETHFTFGGKGSLSGLDLVNVYNEKTGEHYIRLFDTNANNELKARKFDMNFYSRVAGVTLVGEELELNISLEFVDYDADGAKDDLKLGIWFGGRLYNNRYIYVTDYVNLKHCIGNKLTIWTRNGASFSVGRMSEWLDWSAFGLTANWKKTLLDTDFNLKYALAGGNPYTGDATKHPYVTVVVCLVAIALCGRTIVKRRREENGIQR